MTTVDVREGEKVTEIIFSDEMSLINEDLYTQKFELYLKDEEDRIEMKIKDIDNLIEALKIAKKEWSE